MQQQYDHKKRKIGRWTPQQNLVYINYIKRYKSRTQKAVLRKRRKIFKHMSQGIRSRTADQCRSHHQKQLERFGSVEAIITSYLPFSSSVLKEKKISTPVMQKTQNIQVQEQVIIQQKTGIEEKEEEKSSLIPKIKLEEFKIKFEIPDNLMWSW